MVTLSLNHDLLTTEDIDALLCRLVLQQESIDGVPLALLVGLSVGEVDNSRFFRTADDSISLECHDVTCISYCLTVTFDSESDRLLSLTGNAHEEHRLVCCSRCCYELFTSYHLGWSLNSSSKLSP